MSIEDGPLVLGEAFLVTVTAIKTGSELGFDTRHPLAITQKVDTDGTIGRGIYPIPVRHSLRVGDIASVIAHVREHSSGGSSTFYSIIPLVGD